MNVFKRDGRKVDFSGDKIRIAVLSAFSSVGQLTNEDYDVNKDTAATDIASSIATYVESLNKDLAVEEIQDIVERKLMESQRKDVAKAYIIYRNDRSRFREKYSDFMKEIGVKINATDVQNQNANVDEQSFGGRAGEANDVLLKKYALEHCMSEKSRRNHVENRVYIHDLGHYALGDHNCFHRDTEFITDQGIKTFSDFSDGSSVKVLTKDGAFRDATVKFYGMQLMNEIKFERSSEVKTVVCTSNHRWILDNGTVTTNLAEGNILLSSKDDAKEPWRVVSIKPKDWEMHEAWCVEEPTTHSFTLKDNMITGNCLSLPFDDLLKNGFKTRQTDVRGAKSINSACQLVAVLFQLQSLQQFGGVAATHLDWTLVPYIRFSFYKHYKDGIKYTTRKKDSKFVKFLKKIIPDSFFKKIKQIKFDASASKIRETSIDDRDFYSVESAYEYAMDMTERETHQAMEGLYHNLNTLQSRSGNQLKRRLAM